MRHIKENFIDPQRREGIVKPLDWPDELAFPADMLKAVLYSTKQRHSQTKKSRSKKNSASKRKVSCWYQERKHATTLQST